MKKLTSTIFLALFLTVMAVTPAFAANNGPLPPGGGGGSILGLTPDTDTVTTPTFAANNGPLPPGSGGGSILG